MDIDRLNLSIHEFCAEEDAQTVEGIIPGEIDLKTLRERADTISSRVILMERLKTLVIVLGSVTVHIHQNGKLSVNGVKSLEEAEKILIRLIPELGPEE